MSNKKYSGINTRYFAIKEKITEKEKEYLKYSTGLLCNKPEHKARALELRLELKRLRKLLDNQLSL